MTLALLILAAGNARRYGALKQLVPVGPSGEALLEYAAFDARRAGFEQVVLVIQETQEPEFRRRFADGLGRGMRLRFAHQTRDDDGERSKPWGTGHAVLAARHCVDGPFAVVNADDFYGRDAYVSMARLLRAAAELGDLQASNPPRWAVMGYDVAQTLSDQGSVSRALLERNDRGELTSIREIPEIRREAGSIRFRGFDGVVGTLSPDAPVSMNMWGFGPEVFERLAVGFAEFRERERGSEAEFLLPEFVGGELAAGRATVDVLRASGPWAGMTFEADRTRTAGFLEDLVADGEYPVKLCSS